MKFSYILTFVCLFYFKLVYGQVESIARDKNQNYIIKYYSETGDTLFKGIWVPGNLINPVVDAFIKFDPSFQYKYIYKVNNQKDSRLDLYEFKVKTHSPIKNMEYQNHNWFARYINRNSQAKWSYRNGVTYGIPPGKEEFFSFESNGLPAIGVAYASNLTGLSFPSEDEELPVFVEKALDSLREKSSHVSFRTLVPKKRPLPFSPSDFLDSLLSYVDQSCELGWITNQGICRSLQAKLENADRQLQQGNARAAINTLQAFLNELQALREKQLSSEAYALLYYNGQYLLNKLGE